MIFQCILADRFISESIEDIKMEIEELLRDLNLKDGFQYKVWICTPRSIKT